MTHPNHPPLTMAKKLALTAQEEARLAADTAAADARRLTVVQADIKTSVARFMLLQQHLRYSAIQFKLIKYLLGLETRFLSDSYREAYGETRGRGAGDAPTLEEFVSESLQVSSRTCRRYMAFFDLVNSQHPHIADKVREWWLTWKAAKPKALKAPAKQGGKAKSKGNALAAPGVKLNLSTASLSAEDLEAMLATADDLGLYELFEKPLIDVTPPQEDDEAPSPDEVQRLLSFWERQFCKRALNNEFLKLPKPQREALLTTMEESAAKIRDSLKKGGKAA